MLFIALMISLMQTVLYDFNLENNKGDWRIVDDVVMGGRSNGHYEITEAGHGHFYGSVSLENNGGFSSVRNSVTSTSVDGHAFIELRLKGDGKRYQFRLKDEQGKRYSYIQYFETTGDWQTIKLPLADFYPSFRGQKLDLPNFQGNKIDEMAILIANYKAEDFDLLIDYIALAE